MNNYFPKFTKKEKELLRVEHQKGMIENSVNFFSYNMKHELLKHLDRPGWKKETISYLKRRLNEELWEFDRAIFESKSREEVLSEGADVANIVMMIADIYREGAIVQ